MLRPVYPWKDPLPIVQEAARGVETVWVRKISPPCRFQPRTDPPLASHNTEHGIWAVLTYDSASEIILVIKITDEVLEEMS